MSGRSVVFGVLGALLVSACQTESSTPLTFDAGAQADGAPIVPGDVVTPPDGTDPDGGAPAGGTACIASLHGSYMRRNDGKLLHKDGKTPVVDAATGLPLAMATATDGYAHACGTTPDAKAVCWRLDAGSYANNQGQLGNGTKSDAGPLFRATPVLVSAATPLTGVTGIGASYPSINTSCAVADGKAYCWGDLSYLVNKGNTLVSPYAQAITKDGSAPLTNVKQVAFSDEVGCALVQAAGGNEVWCWGKGSSALGQGDSAAHQYPVKVLGLTNPSAVSVTSDSGTTSCAIDGGQVRCWGSNAGGACGNDSTGQECLSPTLVLNPAGAPLDDATQLVTSVGQRICVLRGDKTVWCWGNHDLHATNLGVPNVMALASAGLLTDDGVYHPLARLQDTVSPSCGAL